MASITQHAKQTYAQMMEKFKRTQEWLANPENQTLYVRVFKASEAHLEKANKDGNDDEIRCFGSMAREWLEDDDLEERDQPIEDEVRAILKDLGAPAGTLNTLKANADEWNDLISDLVNLWIDWDDSKDCDSDDE